MAKSQLKAGAILNYFVIVLNILVGLLYTPYMLSMMGQSEYGLYSLVASVIAYLTVLDLGLGNAVVRYTAKYRAEGNIKEQYEMLGMFFTLYLIIGAISFIAGLGLYFNVDFLFGDTMTDTELDRARIMMIILIFNLAYTFPMSIFRSVITAYEHFIFPRVLSILRTILNTAIMIGLLHMGYKAIAMVVLQTIFNVTTLFLEFLYCKKKLHTEMHFGKFKWDFLREVAIYSFWIFLNVIMDKIYWNTGQFVLGAVSGTVAISIYAVAIQLHSMYMHFSTAISALFLPKVTGMVTKNNNHQELSDLFIKTGRLQNIVMSLILFGFIAFGRQFIILWAGIDYEESFIITLLFFVSLYIPLIQNLGITILQARNEMKFRSLLYIAIATVSLVFQVILAKQYGGIGCAIAIAGALFIGQGLIMNVYYHRVQHLDTVKFWIEIGKMDIVPIVVTTIAVLLLRHFVITSWLQFVYCILFYSIVYLPLYYMFSMNKSEKSLLVTPIKKLIKR